MKDNYPVQSWILHLLVFCLIKFQLNMKLFDKFVWNKDAVQLKIGKSFVENYFFGTINFSFNFLDLCVYIFVNIRPSLLAKPL